MSSLVHVVSLCRDELRDGIAWVVFWREGRSWKSNYFYIDSGFVSQDDFSWLHDVCVKDPAAVVLNGYYCGHLSEDMNLYDLSSAVRWHYEHGSNLLRNFLSEHSADPADPDYFEQVQLVDKEEKEEMDKSKGIKYYVIGGQYIYHCFGGTPTLLGAKRLANKHLEYWDNWQGWHVPDIYRAEDCIIDDGDIYPACAVQPVVVGGCVDD